MIFGGAAVAYTNVLKVLAHSWAVYTCAPSDFYDSLGHASTERVTWEPVCPRLELQPAAQQFASKREGT